MSDKAQALVALVKELPPDDFQAVAAQIIDLQARRRKWEEQRSTLRAMQSRHAGRGMLKRLLAARGKDRSRG